MNKLQTQIGQFAVFFDGTPLKDEWQKMPNIRKHLEVDGRYCFKYEFKNDNRPHSLKCMLEDYTHEVNCGLESGEDLETIAFNLGDFKLSLGLKGNSIEELSRFDYGIIYLPEGLIDKLEYPMPRDTKHPMFNGLQYNIRPDTKSQTFTFCVAWVFKNNEEESRTWFAADVDYEPND